MNVRELIALIAALVLLLVHPAQADGLPDHPLSVDEAVQIALSQNPDARAIYAEVGIAQADVVAAGRLKNPLLEGYDRFPHSDYEVSVSFDFLDLLLRGARKKLAEAEFQQTKWRVADAVNRLTYEVRTAYYTLQADQQAFDTQSGILEAAQASAELAQQQLAAGNLSELDMERQRAAAVTARADWMRMRAMLGTNRQQLARLMGVTTDDWKIAASLSDIVAAEPTLAQLQEAAPSQRADIAAARMQNDILARKISLARSSVSGPIMLGVSTAKDAEGKHTTGPVLAVGLPIFNQNQGEIRRLQAEQQKGQSGLDGLLADARAQVRTAYDRMIAMRELSIYYRDEVLPMRRRILALTLQQYNAMLSGVYVLLQTRQDEIVAHREYVEALRGYWLARAALQQAVGGRLPAVK